MDATISFKNKSKTITINNLKEIEYTKLQIFDDPLGKSEIVSITENFNKLKLSDIDDEVSFIGDDTLTIVKSSIESILFNEKH